MRRLLSIVVLAFLAMALVACGATAHQDGHRCQPAAERPEAGFQAQSQALSQANRTEVAKVAGRVYVAEARLPGAL
jgi:hypothetical protein